MGQTVWTYDAAQRVSAITATGADGSVQTSYGYSYDSNDWLTSQTVTTGSGSPVTTAYRYDGSGEVTQAGNEHFSYDLDANQTSSPSGTDTIGADNELMSDGTNTYQYDAVGNLVTMTNLSTGDVWTYSYDLDNRLVKVVEQSSSGTMLMTATYGFDALGDRITKSVWTAATGTVTTNFGFDNGQIWDDLSSTGTVQNRYILGDGPDNVLAQVTGTTVYWLVTDRQGSVVLAVNGAGTGVVEAMSYDAFGNETTTGTVVTTRGYTGVMTDAETGMQYHSLGDGQQAGRVYDPTTGTFTTRDPDSFGGGQSNLYAYAANAPTNLVDPAGLDNIYVMFIPNSAVKDVSQTLTVKFYDKDNKDAPVGEVVYSGAIVATIKTGKAGRPATLVFATGVKATISKALYDSGIIQDLGQPAEKDVTVPGAN